MDAELPRGAGRARLFRPELFDKPKQNSSEEDHPRDGTSSSTDSESISERSFSAQRTITQADKMGTKG